MVDGPYLDTFFFGVSSIFLKYLCVKSVKIGTRYGDTFFTFYIIILT